jgi:GT2 family glycosyltransferase
MIDLSVIVVTYNSAGLIGPCLDSLLDAPGMELEVFVVDNASADGTADRVHRRFPEVRLIQSPVNRGFGAANNLALPQCGGRRVLFLNPDTLVRPGALAAMSAFLGSRPQVGLAGPRLVYPDGRPQESVSHRYLGQKYAPELYRGLQGEIAWVMGACMMAPVAVVRHVGGFDERFFLYAEEEDLCLRIRQAGWEIGFAGEAVVVHVGGYSEAASPSYDVWRRKFLAEYVFYRKHYPPAVIRRITRDHLLKARWRFATLRLLGPFTGDRARVEAKLAKYRALCDTIAGAEASGAAQAVPGWETET